MLFRSQTLGRSASSDEQLLRPSPPAQPGSAVAPPLPPLTSLENLKMLQSGPNEGKRIDLKVLCPLSRTGETPISLLAMDRDGNTCALSVYHLDASILAKIKADKDRVSIVDPVFKNVDLNGHSYPLIQINSPFAFFVNGKLLSTAMAHAAMNSTSL